MLISIVSSYQQYFGVKPPPKDFANLDTIPTSTPKKRGVSPSIGSDISPLGKRAKSQLEDSFTQPENTSYFGGLLDSPSANDINIFHKNNNTPTLTKKISPATKNTCLKELLNNEELSDVTINAFCVLLKVCFPSISGLQDPIFSQNLSFKKVERDITSVQIHHDSKYHWVCSCYDGLDVYLYDSMFNGNTTMSLDTQLALLYADEIMQLEIIVPKIQRQAGSKDCGLFAVAAATAIASGQDPVYLTWNQSEMRRHFIKCIETETVTPFPSKARGMRTGKFPKPHRYTIECICDCNLPEFAFVNSNGKGGTHLIECDKCGFWFHSQCYSLPNSSFDGSFYCTNCNSQTVPSRE